MCGIAGLLAPGLDPDLAGARVRESVARLVHRGPDAEGHWSEPGVITLGQRRLEVLDPEGGGQPWADPSDRIVCVYNGELYNHRELRAELEGDGERFASRSDTEVFARAFGRWGTRAFGRFEGMFAAALWLPRKRELTLVRDRAGEKPLYFARSSNNRLAFSSEIRSLLALLDETPALAPAGLWSYLTLGYSRHPSLLEGVEELEPGTFLVATETGVRTCDRYWRARPHPENREKEATLEKIRETVGRAVRARLEADVPLGAFLSGGVDSTIVVHEMRAAGVEQLETFSAGFPDGEGFDESPWAERVARELGTTHHAFKIEPSVALIEGVLGAMDQPLADSSAIAVWPLARLARSHITVALGGDGGDEVFAGYARFAGVLLTQKAPRPLRSALAPLAGLVPSGQGYKDRGERLARVLRDSAAPPLERLLRWQAISPPEEALALLKPDARPGGAFPWPLGEGADSADALLHELLRVNFESYLPDDLLVKTDRMTMAHGLELRSPFLDSEVIALGHSLPARGLVRGMQLKCWLREAYRGLIADELLDRPKHGFGVPLHLWLRGKLKPWTEARLRAGDSPLWQWIDSGTVLELWEAHQQQRTNNAARLWSLIVLDTWLRRNLS